MTDTLTHPAFYSVLEFAALLSVNKHTIYRAIDRGDIAWIKVGGAKRIPYSELERLQAEAQARRSA